MPHPHVVLEMAIAEAIREYEKSCPNTVIGVMITRTNRKLLEVTAMTIPGSQTGGKRRSKVSMGSLEIETKS
jgi:hypothetical protein